jgi:hypothetical protein
MWMRQSLSSLIAFLLLTFSPLNARVVRVEVTSRNDVLGGKTFAIAGVMSGSPDAFIFRLLLRIHTMHISSISLMQESEKWRGRILFGLHGNPPEGRAKEQWIVAAGNS